MKKINAYQLKNGEIFATEQEAEGRERELNSRALLETLVNDEIVLRSSDTDHVVDTLYEHRDAFMKACGGYKAGIEMELVPYGSIETLKLIDLECDNYLLSSNTKESSLKHIKSIISIHFEKL